MKPKFENSNKKFIVAMLVVVGVIASNVGLTGLPPTTLSGLYDTIKTTTFNFFTPNYQSTKVTGGTLLETGNKNILDNPSFESVTSVATGWTTSGCTASAETTVVIEGKRSLKMACSAQTLSVHQDSTLYASQAGSGVDGVRRVRVWSDVSGVEVCSRRAGSTVAEECVDVIANSAWGQIYEIPSLFGATSNGIIIKSDANITGNVYIDDAEAAIESTFGQAPLVTAWTAETGITTNGFGTITSASWKVRQVGDSLQVRGYWVSGTMTASTAYIQLPSKWTINHTKSPGTGNNPFVGWSQRLTTETFAASSRYPLFTDGSTAGQIYFAFSGSGSTFLKVNGSTLTSSTGMTVDFTVPLNEFSSSINTYTSQCQSDLSCADVMSLKGSAAGVVTEETVDFITGNCTDATPFVCTFNTALNLTVAPNCVANLDDVGDGRVPVVTTTTTASVYTKNSGGTNAKIKFELFCQRAGADYRAKREIIGSFVGIPTTPGITRLKICKYFFGGVAATLASPTECAASPCIEVYDSCSAASAPTRTSAGQYADLTFANGTWANSSALTTKCQAFDLSTGTPRDCNFVTQTSDQTWATNSSGGAVLNIHSYSNGGTDSDSYMVLTIEGQAP